MIKVRRGVFETNSSSTHSVSITNNSHVPSELIVENWYKDTDGDSIVVDLCGFCSNGVVDSQNDKLAFLILQIAYITEKSDCIGYCSCDVEKLQELYDTEEFKELEAEICEYTDTDHIRINVDTGGYIDHDSVCLDMDDLKYHDLMGYSYSDFVFGSDTDIYFEFCG